MSVQRGVILALLVAAVGCASTPPPPEKPIVVEAEQQPFQVQAYVPPPDQPPPPEQAPPAKPEQTANGKYRLSVASLRTAEGAARWVRRAESLGYRAEVETATIDGVIWHRVILPGYRTRDDLIRVLDFAGTDFGVDGAWRLPNKGAAPPAPAPAPEAPENPGEPEAPAPDTGSDPG